MTNRAELADDIFKLVLFGPSGVGKTTVVRQLLERLSGRCSQSLSWTTRSPRTGEVHGQDYHFTSREEYERVLDRHGFVEHAEVHGNCYGTPIDPIRAAATRGDLAMIFAIDYQGGGQMAERLHHVTQVMLVPPSIAVLENRLRGRGTDDEATIQRRITGAVIELAHHGQAQHILINDETERVVSLLERLIRGETIPSDCDGQAIKRLIAGGSIRVAA